MLILQINSENYFVSEISVFGSKFDYKFSYNFARKIYTGHWWSSYKEFVTISIPYPSDFRLSVRRDADAISYNELWIL